MTRPFAIVANGFADGPAQALRDYLVARDARVVMVSHPLTAEQGSRHVVSEYSEGRRTREWAVDLRVRPPLSFALDPLVPMRLERVDTWFGFNPLAAARGLVERRLGRAKQVVLWSVDFVPDRFGASPVTRLYDRLDRFCCTRADARVELSAAAQDGRNRRHRLAGGAPTYVVPMGAWLDRAPRVPEEGYERRRVVFLGHLVAGQGLPVLLEALALLRSRGETIAADIVGTGPQHAELEHRARALGLGDAVRFHGFVEDSRDVERLLAQASIGVAPYEPTERTFKRYADPGKLKAYAAAGLPTVLTDVPPNAGELAREAGAQIVSYDATAIADTIAHALADPADWQARRGAALAYARRFDWPVLFDDLLAKLGFG